MDEGAVELLGTFTKLGPNKKPGWIIKVTSETGKAWDIEMIPDRKRIQLYIREILQFADDHIGDIPWEYWDGDENYVIGHNTLYTGDNPNEYARLRDKVTKEQR